MLTEPLSAHEERRLARLAALAVMDTEREPLFDHLVALAAQVPVRRHNVTIVDRAFVARAHRLAVAVHVWTIDDPDEMRRLLDLGVDGIMTDRPAVLRDVLRDRGQWVGSARAG